MNIVIDVQRCKAIYSDSYLIILLLMGKENGENIEVQKLVIKALKFCKPL